MEAATGKQGALMAKRTHSQAVSAFKSFLRGKKGYCLITRLGGSGQPVMLWSKHRLGGYKANIVNSSKLYAYEKGKVELVGKVANGSSGEWLSTYKGKLRFGDYQSRNYVTVKNGAFQGVCYSVKWTKDGKASYWKQKIVCGKKLGAKKRVGAKLGQKRVYESLGKTLKFMKLPKAAK